MASISYQKEIMASTQIGCSELCPTIFPFFIQTQIVSRYLNDTQLKDIAWKRVAKEKEKKLEGDSTLHIFVTISR
jgi:hypothetical protein